MSRLLFSLVCAVLLAPSLAAAVQVGVAPATRKVLPADDVPDAVIAELHAARGEWEAFQLVIVDPAGATGLNVELSDLSGPDGASIAASQARLYREWFLDVQVGSPGQVSLHERDPGLYPDPLIPLEDPWGDAPAGAPFDLAPGEVGVVFVDLFVPRDAVPGEYSGTAAVAGGPVIDVRLTVWPFQLPAERTVATSFAFSYNIPGKFHGGSEGDDAANYPAILHRYYEALHEHRIDPTRVVGPVDFEFDEQGQLQDVDWTEYDAAVEPWMDGSKFDDGVGVTRFDVARFSPGHPGGLDSEEILAAGALARHLDERGWWDRAYVYAIDEPVFNGGDAAYQQIHDDVQALVDAEPLWEGHTLVTSSYDERIDGDVGIWCPVNTMLGDWFYPSGVHPGAEFYAERADLGEELWIYVCNADFPPAAGYDIDTAIGYEPRIVKWGAWYEGATGFLYWRTNFWVADDPWNVFRDPDLFGSFLARNSDGFLLYPGDHAGTEAPLGSPDEIELDGPIVSYRLKQIRDGLEDWELFRLAEDLGVGAFAREQVERAHTRFGDIFTEDCTGTIERSYCPDDQPWTLDEEVLLDARRQVAAKVAFLTDPDNWPDPEAVEPPAEQPPAEDDGCACSTNTGGPSGLLLALVFLVSRSSRWRARRR